MNLPRFTPQSLQISPEKKLYNIRTSALQMRGPMSLKKQRTCPPLQEENNTYEHMFESTLGKDLWWFYDYAHVITPTEEDAVEWLQSMSESIHAQDNVLHYDSTYDETDDEYDSDDLFE